VIGGLLAGAWARLAAIGAAVVLAMAALITAYGRGRRNARRDAELRAHRVEQERRDRADEASRDYRRDGAADRLRDERF
jgi:hypothetical protein